MAAAYDRKAVEAECVQILVQARDRPAQLQVDGYRSLVGSSKHPIIDRGLDVRG
jgi:hypothetical protein